MSGLNFGNMFQTGATSMANRGAELQSKIDAVMQKDEVSPEDMLQVNFEMGQYNAMLEALAGATKSMTDALKSLTQRTG